ncbi:pheromone B alpha 2 receptor [Alternaria rosae]|uniref:pheromone B alpha 2 receptor n=1 Tax=Alternaria rosae TaxID=1187941 RepID=UPI001E8E74C3|nr:pheromone B alpha 2 receptor [Alternaria rosae]KAH6848483.1 pheromone B alpha 2 receptor [Alternaria rosae]
MIWHFRQTNIAAGSLILWIVLHNLFNCINPLIWPRDNLTEWWDGRILCDIQIRLQVGSYVGLTASLALVLRKLAHVMDTRNMTVSTSHKSKVKAKIWEVFWCWGVPLFLMGIYYVTQYNRYAIIGIAGCWSVHDASWPSMVISFMWSAVGIVIDSYWASLLIYRLYRYRREFHRLVAARNTTSSRFIRLFLVSLIVISFYLIYTIVLLIQMAGRLTDKYSWDRVHDPERWNTITRTPSMGHISIEKWVQIATGYIIFLFLGTGVDANAHYRRILISMGAGKIWPSLLPGSANWRRPTSFSAPHSWTSYFSSRAKKMLCFGTSDSTRSSSTSTDFKNDTWTASTYNSVALDAVPRLHSVTTQDTLISKKNDQDTPLQKHNQSTSPSLSASPTPPRPTFFTRYFTRPSLNGPILHLFSYRNITEINSKSSNPSTKSTNPSTTTATITTDTNPTKPPTPTLPSGVHTRAWAEDISSSPSSAGITNEAHSHGRSVHVVREVHQQRDKKRGGEFERVDREMRDWA